MTLQDGLITGLNTGLGDGLGGGDDGGAVVLPSTVNELLTSDDPMQSLIDMMGYTTKPDYMHGGNEASGSTEIGGSGYDLTASGSPLQEQTSAVLGAGDHTVFNSTTDSLRNTSDGALQPGAGSFSRLWIGSFSDLSSSRYFFGDRDGVDGWVLYRNVGSVYFYVNTASGAQSLLVGGHGADEIQVIFGRRNMADSEMDLITKEGTATAAVTYAESVNSTSQAYAIGDTNVGNAANFTWGVAAAWNGTGGNAITQTHINNLLTALGE